MHPPPLIRLHAIQLDGHLLRPPGPLPDIVAGVVAAAVQNYARAGYCPPWIGYLAFEAAVCVGACGFKTPPVAGAVEIAYFTFPDHEGRGVATRMAQALSALARQSDPAITLRAQTLPAQNASTAILKRLGFVCTGTIAHPEDGPVWDWVQPSGEPPSAGASGRARRACRIEFPRPGRIGGD
jgi:GNAT superfamily N-acetyltransferase